MRPRRLGSLIVASALCLTVGSPVAQSASPPKMRASAGTKMVFAPASGVAGTSFRAKVRGLRAGERTEVWELSSGRTRRVGAGRASRKGSSKVKRATARSARPGWRKVCVRGKRSRRVACGRYRVLAASAEGIDDLDLPDVDDLLPNVDDGPPDATDGPPEPGEDDELAP